MPKFISIPTLEPRSGVSDGFVWTVVSIPSASIKEIRKLDQQGSGVWEHAQTKVEMKDGGYYYTRLSLDEVTEKLNA